jgi:hypothetical protein
MKAIKMMKFIQSIKHIQSMKLIKSISNQRYLMYVLLIISFFLILNACIKQVKQDEKTKIINQQEISNTSSKIKNMMDLGINDQEEKGTEMQIKTGKSLDLVQNDDQNDDQKNERPKAKNDPKNIDPKIAKLLSPQSMADAKLFAQLEKTIGTVPKEVFLMIEKKKQGASREEILQIIDQQFPIQLTIRNALKTWLDQSDQNKSSIH